MQPLGKGRQGEGHPWEKVGLGTAQAILQCCWHLYSVLLGNQTLPSWCFSCSPALVT